MDLSIDIKSKLHSYNMDISLKTSAKRVGILGESGAGKSMLLKYISGIISPDVGIIKINDIIAFDSTKKNNIKPQKRDVAYMFQNYALFPNMNVRENIEIVLKGNKEFKKNKAFEYMKKFHISDLADKMPKDLSGGQQQRVALARIMAYEPQIILLDEPFSALDNDLKDKLQIELEEMLSDFDGMVIMVSHSREEIYRFSDELVIIENGKVVEQGPTKKVFNKPKTLAGAKMVGVNNIISAYVDDDCDITIPDFDIKIERENISNDIKYIGIRDTDFKLLSKDKIDNNTIDGKVEKIYRGLESTMIYFSVIRKSKNYEETKISEKNYCIKLNNLEAEKYLENNSDLKISMDREKIVYIES
ncbi:sulfate/molybdate ABC transporter ATP-binding protein [Peptostreptococcus equinus]|uniref:ATP-binding cassette domain-containing protein n=1 Tax=Peptostreptococcus equinus TaxID=3003601 RepID=A0ABY7JRL3_9FIRM|nr:ATP-binding cassette domain-containing protein [Peptostreptococcus sp. CBA3647]WAW14582.1 ATP-binding cassette domain-containing protein [Peptostreptococcus sp. CBA3647]